MLYLSSLNSVSLRDGVAVAIIWIFEVIFVKVQSLLQQSVVTARRIQVVWAYALALLRDNVPDQALPCEDTKHK